MSNHTETEARELRCCGPDGCGAISMCAGTSERDYRYCVGSKCMAWQWDDGQQNSYDKTRPPGDDWEKLGNFWTRTPKPGASYRAGYCGLLP